MHRSLPDVDLSAVANDLQPNARPHLRRLDMNRKVGQALSPWHLCTAVAVLVLALMQAACVTINLPPHVTNVGVDLAIELEQLAFSVLNRPLP